jgi:MT0933-like antitoxin protein
MGGFMDKAENLADKHDDQVDQGLDKAGEFADQKTGGKYDQQIDKGVDAAQERTGDDQQQ